MQVRTEYKIAHQYKVLKMKMKMKMKTFLCEESVLCHNKRNCFLSYPDHYLISNMYCNTIVIVVILG